MSVYFLWVLNWFDRFIVLCSTSLPNSSLVHSIFKRKRREKSITQFEDKNIRIFFYFVSLSNCFLGCFLKLSSAQASSVRARAPPEKQREKRVDKFDKELKQEVVQLNSAMASQIACNFLLTNINLMQRNDLTKTEITANQNKREIAQRGALKRPSVYGQKNSF